MNITDRTRVRAGRTMGVLAVLLSVSGVLLILVAADPAVLIDDFVLQTVILGAGFGAFAWIVVRGQPRNIAVWMLTWAALVGGIQAISAAVLDVFITSAGIESVVASEITVAEIFEQVHPAAVVPLWSTNLTAVAPFFLVILSWLYFPDGALPSRRWRFLPGVAVAAVVLTSSALAWNFRPSSTVLPYADPSDYPGFGIFVFVGMILGLFIAAASIGSLFLRYRRSDETVRRQVHWIMWGGGAVIAGLGVEIVGGSQVPSIVAEAALIGSYGIAITKYRLYDIDVIISKTFVYGSLAAFIGGVYVAVVVGLGSVFGGGTDANPVLAVAATALIAVAFQPLRARLRKVANRIVYGKKATPYEVLSEFSRQVAATDESLLEPLARSLAEGTSASAASIWAVDGGTLRQLSAWPESETARYAVTVSDSGEVNVVGANVVLPIAYDGEVLGALALVTPAGEALSKPDMELAEELTAGIGLAMRNIRLTHNLQDRVAELRESRQRIVTVQDETRRELERDLHDGAQQRLVALKVKLALAGQIATRDGATRTADFLGDLSGQADVAISELRDFARVGQGRGRRFRSRRRCCGRRPRQYDGQGRRHRGLDLDRELARLRHDREGRNPGRGWRLMLRHLDNTIRVGIARVIVGAAFLLAIIAVGIYVAKDVTPLLVDDWVLHNVMGASISGIVVWLALPDRPRNGALWVLVWVSLFSGLQTFGAALGLAVTGIPSSDIDSGAVALIPGDLELFGAIGFLLAQAVWVPAMFLLLTLGILLFPNGNLPSAGWRWVARFSVVATAGFTGFLAWNARPWSSDPYFTPSSGLDLGVGLLFGAVLASVIASVIGLVLRFRRSSGEVRQQFRWVTWGYTIGWLALAAITALGLLDLARDVARLT